jgi:hypothetical protein
LSIGTLDPESLGQPPPVSALEVPADLGSRIEPDVPSTPSAAIGIADLLRQRVSLAGRSFSAGLALGVVVAVAAMFASVIAFLLGTVVGPPAPEAASVTAQHSDEVAKTSTSTPARAPDAAKAVVDDKALGKIEGTLAEQRSPDEILTLARGQAARKQKQVLELGEALKAKPNRIAEAQTKARLLEFSADPTTGIEALAIIAGIEGPIAADLMYEVWTGTQAKTDLTAVAEQLIYSKALRSKASPALSVALDLRRATTCEEYQSIIPRAADQGDKRSLHLLARLMRRHGCGPRKTGDCYKCLREGDELKEALKAVRSRPEPKFR